MVNDEERRTASLKKQVEMVRTCRKASPPQMGAGNDYVEPRQKQGKQKKAKYQMGRLFQRTSGTRLSVNILKILKNLYRA